MNREELDRELDKWLDRAAAEYGMAETQPGFEARIIAKLNRRLNSRRWYFSRIPAAAAVAAILFLSIYLIHNQSKDHRTTEISSARYPGSGAAPAASADFAGKHVGRSGPALSDVPLESSTKRSVQRHGSPKAREVKEGRFLSSGLSDRERYLIAFVRALSTEKSQDALEKTLSDPLQIKDAHVPAFKIQDFDISPFEIEVSPTPTPGNEEQL
jgi:hypothetical protein